MMVSKLVSSKISQSLRPASKTRSPLRARILAAALRLLESEGPEGVTTRAVADAARVQPPILYRQFGDKRGLLDALAEYGFTSYLSQKQLLTPSEDPVEALRDGWNSHVDFGLTFPAIYLLMYANPRLGTKPPAAEASLQLLRQHIHRVAAAGRLRVSEERASNLFHAGGLGTVLTLLGMPEGDRDMSLSKIAREAAITAITTEEPAYQRVGSKEAAIALRATLNEAVRLSVSERTLLAEWLDRISS